MSELKYTDEKIMSDNPFMDIIVTQIKTLSFSCVVKDEYAALDAETVESLKESETYMSCCEGHIELGIFKQIPHSFLVQVGVPDNLILKYEQSGDQIYIPDKYHDDLVHLMIPWYIEHYEEKNEYYRMITGLPPVGDPGIPVRDYDYLIPEYITYTGNFFHEIGYQVCRSLDKLGVLDVVRSEYPEYKYLNYLTQGIDLYDARKKMDMQILYHTDQMNADLTKEFEQRYAESRKYVLNTQYSLAFEIESPFYHSFMMVYTMLITLIDMIVNIQRHIVTKDILDRRCIQYIFSMYGIPYYRTIPYKYQERMCKNIHNIVKNKSCDKGFIELTKLFGFEDLQIFKWFIIKNRKMNAWGEYLYDTTDQMVCNKNDFIYQETVVEKMSDNFPRHRVPEDMNIMKEYYGGMGGPPTGSRKYVDKYIPFPFEYFLQKGNVMIVRLDDYVCQEDIDYVVYDYNIIRFLNGIAYGKIMITYDFYYDINTAATQDFPVDTSNRIDTYVAQAEATDNDHVFDLRDTKLNDFFISGTLQFEVILNGTWLPPNKYFVDYEERTITIDSSVQLDHWSDDLHFVCIKPARFDSLYDKKEVEVQTDGQVVFDIPEPFERYVSGDNNFFLTINNNYVDPSRYTTSTNPAQLTFTTDPGLLIGNKLGFHFFYSNMAVNTGITVCEKVVKVVATEPYQYEFHVEFPVNHYVESGYKVYIKLLDWWLPAKFFSLIGNDTIVFLDRSIAKPTPGREMELHFFYMPYDATEQVNLQTSTSYQITPHDFKKNFDITFPFADFLDQGNELIVDSEGILLRRDIDYTLTMTDDIHGVITIPNRDYRPMKDHRVNYTFFFNNNAQYKMKVANKNVGALTAYDQEITIPFPFYPYLESGHDFILQIGKRVIPQEDITMVDKFHCRVYGLGSADLNQDINTIFFYNTWYINHTASQFIVEWRRQDVTDSSIEMDTPAELYVENRWPYFVTYGERLYLEEDKYDVVNHTFFTNPIDDLLNNTYGNYIDFVYIYSMKDGYMMKSTAELHSSNTDMYFSKAPIDDLHQVQYIKDKSNWKSYDVVTSADGWWDGYLYKNDAHEVIKHDIYQKKFNYERTKYYGVSNTIELGEYSAQMSYFYSMLYDDVFLEENVDLLIPILSDSHRFKLGHLFVYMTVLTYIFNGYEDFIMDTPTKIMYVQGFNFHTDLADIREILRKHHQHPSDFPLWDYIKPDTDIPDIAHFVNVFKENFKVRSTILRLMIESNDYREYNIWRKVYNALLIWKYNQKYFALSDGTTATTYTEFLKDKDGLLYESIQNIKSYTDLESMQDMIINITDSIVYIMEKYLDSKEFKYLYSQLPGYDANKAAKYLHMMIDFFKSYKIVLLPRTETMDLGDANDPDNYFRGIDQIHTINESTIQADYMIPYEKTSTQEHMLLQEWTKVPDETLQVINYNFQTHNANDDNTIKITDTGRWMKEDVSIEPYGKGGLRFDIYPCVINVNKIFTNTFLESLFTYVRDVAYKYLDMELTVEPEPFDKIILTSGTVSINSETFDPVYLTGIMTLDGKLFLDGYKMMTVYRPIYQTMGEVPFDDIADLNERIEYQRKASTIMEMYKNSYKLQVVPEGLIYTNENGMIYYDDMTDFCCNCFELSSFPFATHFFPDNNNPKKWDRAFYKCKKLESLPDFDLVEYAANNCNITFTQIFYQCTKMTKGIGLLHCTRDLDFTEAYYECSSLTEGPSIAVMYGSLNLTRSFYKCTSLTRVPDIIFPEDNKTYPTKGLITLDHTFEGCTAIDSYLTATGKTFTFVNNEVQATVTFKDCSKLPKGITTVISAKSKVYYTYTYAGCTAMINSGNYTVSTDSELHLVRTYKDCNALTYAARINAQDTSRVYLDHTFEGCKELNFVEDLLESDGGNFYLDTTFKDCVNLKIIKIDMAHVKSWDNIFVGCTGLVSVTFLNTTPAMQMQLTHAILDGGTLTYSMTYL